jgi:hypothetical protein
MKNQIVINNLSNNIENGSIKWLPWIGENYFNGDKRILVVGESHYYNPQEVGSFEKHQSPTFTQEVIDEMARQRDYYNTKIFQNFHKALIGNDEFDADKFWNQLAFFNFVQRPMDTNKGRPGYDDFLESWKSFKIILSELKPTLVIFIGTSAANAFNEYSRLNNLVSEEVEWLEKIGTSYAKSCSLTLEQRIPILFIRHTSQYFSWSKWNNFLNKTVKDEIDWLNNII